MTDLSTLSDDQLKALYAPHAAAPDLSKMSDDDLKALHSSLPAQDGVASDVLKSGAAGLAKGGIGLAGLPGDAANLLTRGSQIASDYIANKLGFDKGPEPTGPLLPTSAGIQKGVEGVTGEFHKPQTVAGEYAQTAGEFAPALFGGGQGLISKLATRVAAPAALSETAGQITKGTDAEPYARVAGALMSPAITSIGRRAVTPLPASPERSALVDALRNEGVNLTAGQATGSRPLQWAESTFGDMPGAGGRAAQTMTDQGEQFTAAALRRVGENANRATPDVIDRAFNRIGNEFEGVAARNHVIADPQLGHDLMGVEGDYNSLVGPSQRAPVVANTIRDIGEFATQNGGHITGEQYNAMSSRLARQARGAKADPQLQEALNGTREALDDAFERSLQTTGNTADLERLRTARNQYRNLMVVEKAATGAGANTAEGLISPSQLRNAVVAQNRRSYARGRGDFADLARSGEALLKPLPQSGTAPRQNMQHLFSVIGSLVGGTAGSAAGPGGTAAGIAAGLMAPIAAGRALMSRPVQAYLGNQAVLPGARDTAQRALTRALLAAAPQTRMVVHPDDARRANAPAVQ